MLDFENLRGKISDKKILILAALKAEDQIIDRSLTKEKETEIINNIATFFANSIVPSLPLDQCWHTTVSIPILLHSSWRVFISLSVSVTKWFTATIAGNPNFLILLIGLPFYHSLSSLS